MVNDIRKKFKRNKKILLILLFVLMVEGLFFLFSIFKNDFQVKRFDSTAIVEYKGKFNYDNVDVCYGNKIKCNKLDNNYKGFVDSNKIGNYEVIYNYKYKNKKYHLKQKVKVVDKEAPIINVEDENAFICPNGKIGNLKLKVVDNYDGDITDKVNEKVLDKRIVINVSDSFGNISKKEINAPIEDREAPKITLNGEKYKTFYVGNSYEDEGITVNDNCDNMDNIDIKIYDNVDYSTPGSYSITYTARDKSNNESKEERYIDVIVATDNSKDVYLTFDDGPSIYTNELLDVLKKYDVKATFFVTSNGDDSTILREYNEGHTIGLHSNTHDYSYIYSSVDNYFDDLYAIQDRVKRITGYSPNLIRFPGGSSNEVSMNYDNGIRIMSILTEEVQNRGFYYVDWNVVAGDSGEVETTEEVYNNVVNHLAGGYSIVLQHDIKKFSVDAVERIIQYGKANGYVFKALTIDSPKAHHNIAN